MNKFCEIFEDDEMGQILALCELNEEDDRPALTFIYDKGEVRAKITFSFSRESIRDEIFNALTIEGVVKICKDKTISKPMEFMNDEETNQ